MNTRTAGGYAVKGKYKGIMRYIGDKLKPFELYRPGEVQTLIRTLRDTKARRAIQFGRQIPLLEEGEE